MLYCDDSVFIANLVYFRFYLTLSGQKLTGREATRAAEEDKKAVNKGVGPAAKDRSMIMRSEVLPYTSIQESLSARYDMLQ